MSMFSGKRNRPIAEIPTKSYGTLDVLAVSAATLEIRFRSADTASQFARAIRTAFRVEYTQGEKTLKIVRAYNGTLDVPSLAEYVNAWEL